MFQSEKRKNYVKLNVEDELLLMDLVEKMKQKGMMHSSWVQGALSICVDTCVLKHDRRT